MFPASTITDARDVRDIYSELFGQCFEGFASRASSAYLENLRRLEFGLTVVLAILVAAVCVVVVAVFFGSAPDQILETVVRLHAVLVAALETVRARTNERLENKAMYAKHLHRPLEGNEIDTEVSSRSWAEFHLSPAILANAAPSATGPLRPYAAIAADSITWESGYVSELENRIVVSHARTSDAGFGQGWHPLARVFSPLSL